ncbi:MAG TPA: DUF177 domain-containing protein [Bacillota bacterium]
MKVNISSIRDVRGGALPISGTVDLQITRPELGFQFTGPVRVTGTVTNTGEGFLIETLLTFTYEVNCGRCLERFAAEQSVELKEEFIPGYAKEDELAFGFQGDEIDMTDCITEQVILALPMNFICQPECRGLCPSCGKNLNREACECVVKNINPQFAKLKSLLSTEGGGTDGKSKK